jgi:hypothetical protein
MTSFKQDANYCEVVFLYYFIFLMTPTDNNLKFPLWQYLNQPLFSSHSKFVLIPSRFVYLHRIELLKRCWAKECDVNKS